MTSSEKLQQSLNRGFLVPQYLAETYRKVSDNKTIGQTMEQVVCYHAVFPAAGVEDCISGECLRWLGELSRYLDEYENNLTPLLENDSMKPFRLKCQVRTHDTSTCFSKHCWFI